MSGVLSHVTCSHVLVQVVDDASEVLRVQPANMKALFRRAKALLELKQYSRALRDVLLAEQVRPSLPIL